MISNPLRTLWEFMKKIGYFKEYESYSDWCLKRFGEKETLKEWKERELTEEEQKEFEELFGD